MGLSIPQREYNWCDDAYQSWELCIRMMALECGSRRFETLFEMYWIESQGGVP